MDNQDSEPLFGEDVYSLLRDDSLLHRTGSNNFAALIDSTDTTVPVSNANHRPPQDPQIKQEHLQNNLANRTQNASHQNPPIIKHEPQNRPQHYSEVSIEPHAIIKQEHELMANSTQHDMQVDHGGPSQPVQQQVLYQYRIAGNSHVGAAQKVVLITAPADVNEHEPVPVHVQEEPQVIQESVVQTQHQEILSWDGIDGDNDESMQSTSVNMISNDSFMAIVEEASSLLPDTTSSSVPSLQPWGGRYDFKISLPTDNKDRNKWCYSEDLQKLYVCPNVAIPVHITMSQWLDATITITPVFQQSQYRMDPVTRCYNCRSMLNTDPQLADFLVHVEGDGCAYETVQERPIVKVPLQPPPPGERSSILLLKLMCLTSCVGGPNRRPFCLVLTLRCSLTGNEIGRQILDVKCCKCPGRDMKHDTESTAPKTPGEKMTKIRKLSTEINVNKKKKKPNTKQEFGADRRYVNVAVPVEFELQVKSYVNQLIAEDILRRNQPNLLLYPEDK